MGIPVLGQLWKGLRQLGWALKSIYRPPHDSMTIGLAGALTIFFGLAVYSIGLELWPTRTQAIYTGSIELVTRSVVWVLTQFANSTIGNWTLLIGIFVMMGLVALTVLLTVYDVARSYF